MSTREILRRLAIWLVVALFFVGFAGVLILKGDPTSLLGFIAYPVVGGIILTSRPGNGIGRFLLAVSLMWTVTVPMLLDPVLEAMPAWLEITGMAAGWPMWGLLPLVGLLFPTGRIETRVGRVLAWLLVGYVVLAAGATLVSPDAELYSGRPNPLAVPVAGPVTDSVIGLPGGLVFVALIIAILIDLGLRWRRSRGSARLQYRWLLYGLSITVILVGVGGILNLLVPNAPWVGLTTAIAGLATNLIPISIGIAVTRHGLYDIDRVVSRTVSYTLVTAVVVGVYAVVVTSVTLLLPGAPSLAVAGATLAAAAVFLPVLRRVQRVIDRRFDRARYDAQHVVDDFGERVRTGADPSGTAPALDDAVACTLQPVSMGLWTPGGAP